MNQLNTTMPTKAVLLNLIKTIEDSRGAGPSNLTLMFRQFITVLDIAPELDTLDMQDAVETVIRTAFEPGRCHINFSAVEQLFRDWHKDYAYRFEMHRERLIALGNAPRTAHSLVISTKEFQDAEVIVRCAGVNYRHFVSVLELYNVEA